MRVAIIGAGLQGNRRAQALESFPDADLVVVTAKARSGAEPLAKRMRCAADEGWEEVVRRTDIDVVVICTPPDLHSAITLAAIDEGKHVLCEKPLSRTLEEGEAMVRAAEKKGVVLKCGFNHRYHPAIMAAKRHFENGLVGAPVFLRAVYGICGRPGYEKEWRADPRVTSGGQLMEQGIHVVDLFRWFLGEIKDVTGLVETLYWPIQPLEDNAFVIFRAASGVPASLHSSLTQWRNLFSFQVYGDDGYLEVEGLGGGYGTEKLAVGKKLFDRPFEYGTTEFRAGDTSWRDEWKEFMDAIAENREPAGSGRDGLEALRLVFAAYESAKRGIAVSIGTEPSVATGVGS
jgi:predicted dehydrogenase